MRLRELWRVSVPGLLMIYAHPATHPALGLLGTEETEAKTLGHEAAYWWVYRQHGMKWAIKFELWRLCWKAHRLDFQHIGKRIGKSAVWVSRRLGTEMPIELDSMSYIATACNATFDFKIFDRGELVP